MREQDPAAPDELRAAYRVLGLEVTASVDAIKARHRELAQTYHPDKWPHGSVEQISAASRMRAINAAFQMVRHAPLGTPPRRDDTEQWGAAWDREPDAYIRDDRRGSRWDRPVSVAVETAARFALGALCGTVLMFSLTNWQMPGAAYAWLLPLVAGLAAMGTSNEVFWILYLLRR
jgi:DnaJ domain